MICSSKNETAITKKFPDPDVLLQHGTKKQYSKNQKLQTTYIFSHKKVHASWYGANAGVDENELTLSCTPPK
jgi:hypothetical protein